MTRVQRAVYNVVRWQYAGVMELADVVDSKSTGSDTVPVRVRPPAPKNSRSSEREFFIQADRLGISSRFSVYIIKCGEPHLYLITPQVCISVGLMIYKTKVLMICNSCGIDDIQRQVTDFCYATRTEIDIDLYVMEQE